MKNTELLTVGDYIEVELENFGIFEGMVSDTYKSVHLIQDKNVKEGLINLIKNSSTMVENEQYVRVQVENSKVHSKITMKELFTNSRGVTLIKRILLKDLL